MQLSSDIFSEILYPTGQFQGSLMPDDTFLLTWLLDPKNIMGAFQICKEKCVSVRKSVNVSSEKKAY